MGKIGDLYLAIHGDLSGWDKDLKKAGAGADSLAGRLRTALNPRNLATGVGLGLGAAAFGAVTTAISGTIGALGDMVTSAREETVGIAALTQSLETNAEAWDGNIDKIEEVIEARMDLGFADDEQREGLAKLVAITHDETEALDLQRQAMDLARLRHIDLSTASELLGKVYGGNVGILKRFGIQVRAGSTATEALAQIQAMSAGQAEAWAETEEGAAQTANIALGELGEDIGKELLPLMTELARFVKRDVVPALRKYLIPAIQFLTGHMDEVAAAVSGLIALRLVSALAGWGAALGGVGVKAAAALGPIGMLIAAALTLKGLVGTGSFSGAADQLGEIAAAAEEAGVSTDRVREAFVESGMSALDFNTRLLELVRTGMSFAEALRRVGSATTAGVEESGVAWDAYQAQISGAGVVAETGAERIAEALPESIEARHERVRTAAYDTMVAYAAGLIDAQDEPRVALDALNVALNTTLTRAEEIARLKGQLASTHLAAGLDDERPAVRAAAQAARTAIVNQLEDLGVTASEWGSEVGLNFGRGLQSQRQYVSDSAHILGFAVGNALRVESEPPDPRSGLRGITTWGGNIVKQITSDILAEVGLAKRTAQTLSGALAPTLGIGGLASGDAGAAASRGAPPPAGGAGDIIYQLVVDGKAIIIGSREDVLNGWEAMNGFEGGMIPG